MPKINPYARTLPHYIKSEVTLLVYTIYISYSFNAAVTQFCLQTIVKNKFYKSTNWTLNSLFQNKLILKATVFSGAFYPVNFNTKCLWNSFSPVGNEEELATTISNTINSNLQILKLEV